MFNITYKGRKPNIWIVTGQTIIYIINKVRTIKSSCARHISHLKDLTRFNKIAIQGTPQMAVDNEAICLSRVYSYYPKCNFPLFYV